MLSIYVSLTEGMGLPKKISLDDYSDQLPDQSTEHQLLAILEGISQQMVIDFPPHPPLILSYGVSTINTIDNLYAKE